MMAINMLIPRISDEADVFLESRSGETASLVRNALVSGKFFKSRME
jgi:hypothetical protein